MRHQLSKFFEADGNYKISLIAASAVLFFVIWFSTGTLAPYALSGPDELALNQYVTVDADMWAGVIPGAKEALQCRYIGNIDHGHFLATFLMLDGVDKSVWQGSVVLRRILYPILAYPFMKVMGFETGGAIANFFIYFTAFFLFVSFVRREIGRHAAVFAAWALATFPGIAYFGGLPYSYSFIVPGCLVIAILLWHLEKAAELKSILLLSAGLGILFLGYDFLPIFGLAAVIILLRKKQFLGSIVSLAVMAAPTVIFSLILKYYYEVQLTNSNSEMYKIIAFSYLGIFQGLFSAVGIDPNSPLGMSLSANAPFPDLAQWYELLKYFPVYVSYNFLFSTFGYLSVAFILINLPRLFGKRLKLNSVEVAVLVAVFVVFSFSNLAPPFRSWQMRGYGFARLYEPVFVVLILYICRKIQTLPELSVTKRKILLGLLTLMILGNLTTSFSTMLPNNWGLGIYANFYIQGDTTKKVYSEFKDRIRTYGRYPLGTCGHMKEAKVAGAGN